MTDHFRFCSASVCVAREREFYLRYIRLLSFDFMVWDAARAYFLDGCSSFSLCTKVQNQNGRKSLSEYHHM